MAQFIQQYKRQIERTGQTCHENSQLTLEVERSFSSSLQADQWPFKNTIENEIISDLLRKQALISPKYLYDALGSKLFEVICELPEYYLTRTEDAIFADHAPAIAQAAGINGTLIDLGAGNCAKAARLFPYLQPRQYVPVDISVDFLREAVEVLQWQFSSIEMIGVGMDFTAEGLQLPDKISCQQRLFFYPGSSIGNFSPDASVALLQKIHKACGADGGLLISIDLLKEAALLEAAYDDSLGVTAAFNLNVLYHLNQLLDANFDLRQWRHQALFNATLRRVEMHLEAQEKITVKWAGGQRDFVQGETIHTENSYKYAPTEFSALLQRAGFKLIESWTDARDWFMVCYARPL